MAQRSHHRYAQMVHALSENCYANPKYLDNFMRDDQPHYAKYTMINFSPSFEIENVYKSSDEAAPNHRPGKCHTLCIVEDLDGDLISKLGDAFDVEPQFLRNIIETWNGSIMIINQMRLCFLLCVYWLDT
jgi:hypothetical protein